MPCFSILLYCFIDSTTNKVYFLSQASNFQRHCCKYMPSIRSNVIYKAWFLTISNNLPDENTNSVFCHIWFDFRADTTSPIPSSMAVIMAAWWETCDKNMMLKETRNMKRAPGLQENPITSCVFMNFTSESIHFPYTNLWNKTVCRKIFDRKSKFTLSKHYVQCQTYMQVHTPLCVH